MHSSKEDYIKKMQAIFADSHRYFDNPEAFGVKAWGRPAKNSAKTDGKKK